MSITMDLSKKFRGHKDTFPLCQYRDLDVRIESLVELGGDDSCLRPSTWLDRVPFTTYLFKDRGNLYDTFYSRAKITTFTK